MKIQMGLSDSSVQNVVASSSVTKEESEDAMSRLNNRPRKPLEYKTPAEVFFNLSSVLIQNVAPATLI